MSADVLTMLRAAALGADRLSLVGGSAQPVAGRRIEVPPAVDFPDVVKRGNVSRNYKSSIG